MRLKSCDISYEEESQRIKGQEMAKPTLKHHLGLEALEPRLPLSASGLVDVGQQPTGALTGKIVYTHAGHGYTADNLSGGAWSSQRPETFEMVEDLGNQDQMTFFADYLFRAGATVVSAAAGGISAQRVRVGQRRPGGHVCRSLEQ